MSAYVLAFVVAFFGDVDVVTPHLDPFCGLSYLQVIL